MASRGVGGSIVGSFNAHKVMRVLRDATGTRGPWALGVVHCELCDHIGLALLTLVHGHGDPMDISMECPRCGQMQAIFFDWDNTRDERDPDG